MVHECEIDVSHETALSEELGLMRGKVLASVGR